MCFTGPAGVGKSTLISNLLPLAASNKTIAWLACDPSSPKSGGSLLGDRIRSSGKDISESIYIRSMSTRGSGAFSQSIRDVEIFLEHSFDRVWVETAGSGQTQSEIAKISAITVLILQPETGDDVQWMKSGVREWCDLFVIHKSDLPGADMMAKSLEEMGISEKDILKVSSRDGRGLEILEARIEEKLRSLNWKSRGADLHECLAKNLFFERETKKLEKAYAEKKRTFIRKPYG